MSPRSPCSGIRGVIRIPKETHASITEHSGEPKKQLQQQKKAVETKKKGQGPPDEEAQEKPETYDKAFPVSRICDLYAVDPGRDDLITLVRAIPLPHRDKFHKGRAPLTVNCQGDHVSTYVKFELVYRLSKGQYEAMTGRARARRYRRAVLAKHPKYMAASKVNRRSEKSCISI